MSSNNDIMVGNRPLSSLRVVDLKQELEKRGLAKSGSKKDLVERLRLHLQIEKHRDTGASADEEELPNYSVHEELADQNPFIRDYLASQAELFHSQKVVKKLVEEEAKRESETSADESVDSPVKQPPVERDESPIPETRRQSRRRTDSQREDNNMTVEKLMTRSSRSRSPAAATESKATGNNVRVQNEEPKQIEAVVPIPGAEVVAEELKAKLEKVPEPVQKESAADTEQDVSEPVVLKTVDSANETSKSAEASNEEKQNLEANNLQQKIQREEDDKKEPKLEEKDAVKKGENKVVESEVKEAEDVVVEDKTKDDVKEAVDVEEKENVQEIVQDEKASEKELVKEEKEVGKESEKELVNEEKEVVKTSEKELVNEEKEVVKASEDENKEVETKIKDDDSNRAEKTKSQPCLPSAEPEKLVEPQSLNEKEEEPKTEKEVPAEEPMEVDIEPPVEKKEKVKRRFTSRSRSRSPTPAKDKSDKPQPKSPKSHDKTGPVEEKPDKEDSGSSSEEEDSSSRSRGRSRSRSRSPSRSKSRSRSRSHSRSRSRSVESKEEIKCDESVVEKRSETGDDNDEESRDTGPAVKEPQKRDRSRSSSRSVSRSPAREELNEPNTNSKQIEKVDAPTEAADGEPREVKPKSPTKTKTSAEVETKDKARYKSSQKDSYSTKYDLAGEEALDYGEEEEDEDRTESDRLEFSWTRRTLQFKTNVTVPTVTSTCKWKLEEDSKHLIVKSELLNNYYKDIKLVPLEQLKLEEKIVEKEKHEENRESERKVSISKDRVSESEEPLLTRTVENVQPTIKRTVSIVPISKTPVEQTEENDKNLTPPRNPPSNVLLITNLVRPFTLPQLRELLQRTGNLQDIWVDKIKSRCIVMYNTQEEAFETRAALHGVCWPSSNPKFLHVDYTTQENLEEHKAKEGADQNSITEKPVSAQPLPVREWDVGKKPESKSPGRNRKRSRSRSPSRDRSKRSKRSSSPGRSRHSRSPERRSKGGEGKEPEPMGKALDELFRKTIATPSIYWLPLTPEQIAEKEELRRKRMLERERRLAELSKMRPR